MSRARTVTVSMWAPSVESDVDAVVEITGRYVPAKTYGPPERCSPAEYPDVEITACINENGVDVVGWLSDADREDICNRAEEEAAEDARDDGPDPDDENDRRAEMRAERED